MDWLRKIFEKKEFFVIAGPCVIENEEITLEVARFLKEISEELSIPVIFKSSYDKANRTSYQSYRGPGIDEGLRILKRVKQEYGLPILSDVHCKEEISKVEKVLDIIQIPAFLSRQTDLIISSAKTGLPINIKKGQFLAPWDMENVIKKAYSVGNRKILLTERGTCFGYNNLIVDMRSIPIMKRFGHPVIFDATHSVQLPGGSGDRSSGQREFVPYLAKAAVAAGADGVFMEIHPDPENALCDGPNSLPLRDVKPVLKSLLRIYKAAKNE